MVQLGASYAHVARILNYTKLTITRLIQRYRVTAVRPRSGRPRVTTANEDRHLRILHLCNRFHTMTSSAATGLRHVIRQHTVHCQQRQHGIRAYRPFRGMTLMRQHQLRRLCSACQFQCWQHQNWQQISFSDKSRFQLFRVYDRTRIYRRAGERTAPCCVQETVPFGGGSVMVWGGICGQQRTDHIVIDGNLTAHRYLHMVDIHTIETGSLWSNLFTFNMSRPI